MQDRIDRLKNLDDHKLIDVVKNYRQYGYDEEIRLKALSILNDRGITKEHLKLNGEFENNTYNLANSQFKSFKRNSKIALLLYGLTLATYILIPLISTVSETFGQITIWTNWALILSYFIFIIKSFINQNQFNKTIHQPDAADGALLYFLIGMPFYIIMYFYFRSQMKEKIKTIQ